MSADELRTSPRRRKFHSKISAGMPLFTTTKQSTRSYCRVFGEPERGLPHPKGIEKIRSSFANDIYRGELQNLYSEQTVIRNKLRSDAEIVMKNLLSELQNGSIENPQLEQLILKLRLQFRTQKAKKCTVICSRMLRKQLTKLSLN